MIHTHILIHLAAVTLGIYCNRSVFALESLSPRTRNYTQLLVTICQPEFTLLSHLRKPNLITFNNK